MVPEVLGIIAGNKILPIETAKLARSAGVKRIVVAAFINETDPEIEKFADETFWIRIGQLSRLIKEFKSRNVRYCVMAGQISPKSIFDVKPDLRALKLLLTIKEKNAHTIFGAIAKELESESIELIDATPILRPIIPGYGFRLGPRLSKSQESDIKFGFNIAKEISKLDIGQSVVVKDGIVLAVEAFEGTDECLKRGGRLCAKGSAIAIKVAKPNHDRRFDLPCIGPQTLAVCKEAGINVLAIESDISIIVELQKVRDLATKLGISVVTVPLD
jgi:DUF1009 family protein